ncbi:CGNR zinc finger domain-containing protein [Microbispora hainanensis]|uniref:CGNR zinc finger domain-containing protein n=1 Tax=Microbispora hainanensis TaxID=568844 RepID=UPI00142E9CAB|nr:ABATE domain-containing protein [Microbispora hainanensis]
MSLTLHPRSGGSFRFDPGALCLEFLVSGGVGVYAHYETLHEPADLARWAAVSRLGLAEADTTADELARAKALRAALWGLAGDHVHGRTPRQADVDAINSAASAPPLTPVMTADGRRSWAAPATGGQVVATVARDAIELFTGPMADRVRECAGDNCALVFVDTSRPGSRRWCSMERCGNRHKVRTHRSREG